MAKSQVFTVRTSSFFRRFSAGSSHIFPYFALTAFTIMLLWPLFSGRVLYWGDIALYFEPMQRFAGDELKHGRLPLWNPFLLGGQPYLGNPQMGLFYPLSVLSPFVSSIDYLSISTIIHVFLCGLFMYIYLLRWCRWRSSALIGSFVYMGSACLIGRIQFPPMIATAAYCPLILWAIDGFIVGQKRVFWPILCLSLAFLLLAAHPQMAFLILLTSGCYAVTRVWAQSKLLGCAAPSIEEKVCAHGAGFCSAQSRPMFRTLLELTGALAGAMLLSAAQILPMLQLMLESTRERMTPASANRFVFDMSHLITAVFPNFYGHPAHADYWGGGNAWEPALFVGWLPIALIPLAIRFGKRDSWIRFWTLMSGMGLWFSVGTIGGLYWVAFYVIPGLSKFHDPARFLFITTLAIAILTAAGFDLLRQRRGGMSRLQCVIGVVLTALPLWWFGRDWNPTIPSVLFHQVSPEVSVQPLSIKFTSRLYLPEQGLYWNRFVTSGYDDYGGEVTVRPFFHSDLWNLSMNRKQFAASSYEPVPVAAPTSVDSLNKTALRRGEPNLSRLMQSMDAGWLVLPEHQRVYDAQFHRIPDSVAQEKENLLYSHRRTPSRAWLARRVRHVEGSMRIAAALASPDFDPLDTAILSGIKDGQVPALSEWGGNSSRESVAEAEMVSEDSTSAVLRCDCGAMPAMLVYSSTAYPGWRATVDQHPATLSRVDDSLLGVALTSGPHTIALRYAPDTARVGFYLSLAAALALTAYWAWALTDRSHSFNRKCRVASRIPAHDARNSIAMSE